MVDKVNVAMSNDGKPDSAVQHEADMAKVGEANISPDGTAPEPVVDEVTPRPADVPEKFWDAEKGVINTDALLKAQADAEAALRNPAEPKVDDVLPEGETPKPEAQPQVVTDASKEYAEKGELTAETYTALEAAGLPKAMVDEYIAGQTAVVAQIESAAAAPFAGDFDAYNKAADWASVNLTDDEITALDVQLTSTNPAIVTAGAVALQEKFAAGADVAPETVIQGAGNNNTTGTSFKSSAEMQAAMSDPRYKTDEAYRLEVAGKISRASANLFG